MCYCKHTAWDTCVRLQMRPGLRLQPGSRLAMISAIGRAIAMPGVTRPRLQTVDGFLQHMFSVNQLLARESKIVSSPGRNF